MFYDALKVISVRCCTRYLVFSPKSKPLVESRLNVVLSFNLTIIDSTQFKLNVIAIDIQYENKVKRKKLLIRIKVYRYKHLVL